MKVIAFVLLFVSIAFACTNFIVTPGASQDGSSIVSYSADSASLYGCLCHNASAHYPNGTMMEIYEWITGKFLGKIPQAEETYNTIGNTNEFGVVIGETTFGGLSELDSQPNAILDYGNLIYIALQRAKTARKAIEVMTDLVSKYGYASSGESFSIADNKEVWVMEMIGKGKFERGAVWVARRVPDGHVTAHANQARITTFPLNDTENCVYAPDVIKFAKDHGYYPKSSPDDKFSFSDVYNPVDFTGARACELRVWSFFRRVVGAEVMDKYTDYVQGINLKNRMEWSYAPKMKLNASDIMTLMKDHYEDTKFDFTQDVGAGPFNLPYRWRPMSFVVNNKTYINERSTGTQQTGWVFVAECRKNVPDFMVSKFWFGVDDTACTVYSPYYGSNTDVPTALALEGNGDLMDAKLTSSFWVFNLVANLAYTRWRIIYPEIADLQSKLENQYFNESAEAEKKALELYKNNKTEEAVAFLSNYSKTTGQGLHDAWLDFWEYLVPRFLDGNVKTYIPGEQNPNVTWPGYGDAWYERIVNDTGDRYLVPEEPTSSSHQSSSPHQSSAASRAIPGLPSLRKLLSFILP